MSSLMKFAVGVAASFALAMVAIVAAPAARALPTGVQALHLSHGVILARRECIVWRRRPDGTSVCVRWAECGKYVC
jgi:hypothetical protein